MDKGMSYPTRYMHNATFHSIQRQSHYPIETLAKDLV